VLVLKKLERLPIEGLLEDREVGRKGEKEVLRMYKEAGASRVGRWDRVSKQATSLIDVEEVQVWAAANGLQSSHIKFKHVACFPSTSPPIQKGGEDEAARQKQQALVLCFLSSF
jgi:hypothetical protein